MLTGLPNRLLFRDRLAMAHERSKRNNRMFALAYLDVDGFKDINDAWGHRCGDEVLACIGKRLVALTRGSDTAARLGGDEFALLLEEVGNEADPMRRIQLIQHELEQPMDFVKEDGPAQINVRVSIGVALYPRDGDQTDQLLHKADQAMYLNKKNVRAASPARPDSDTQEP